MPIPPIISKVVHVANEGGVKFFDKFANSALIKEQRALAVAEPERFAAKMLVTSIISKDIFNCIFYTLQSWNNKEIEEDKRKFIAAQDAMNGLIMVGGQFFVGKVIDKKFAPWIKSKFSGTIKNDKGVEVNIKKHATEKVYHPDNVKNIIRGVIRDNADELKHKFNVTADSFDSANVDKVLKSVNKKTKDSHLAGLGILVTAIATTGLMKRGVTYLVSTPLAGMITDYLDKRDASKKKNMEAEMTPTMVDMTMPKAKEERSAFASVASK